MDHCIGEPCHHGARCINSAAGFQCDCAGTGFQGTTCDLNINDCIGNPCLNNGRCMDGTNNFSCDCLGTGYHGDRCEIETDDCLSQPCKNNGSCTDEGRTFICDCAKTGYTGKTCDKDVDECVDGSHECWSGSVCQNTEGGYKCLCQDRHTGNLSLYIPKNFIPDFKFCQLRCRRRFIIPVHWLKAKKLSTLKLKI